MPSSSSRSPACCSSFWQCSPHWCSLHLSAGPNVRRLSDEPRRNHAPGAAATARGAETLHAFPPAWPRPARRLAGRVRRHLPVSPSIPGALKNSPNTARVSSGLRVTLTLVAISIVLGGILSLPIAYGRMSKNKVLSWFAYGYVYFFRGTPLITQLFLVYYGLGSFRPYLEAVGLWSLFKDAWFCALFTFTLNTAAYQAEILRGAIESVPRGQHEGAAALGLPQRVAFFKIILPQAMIVALRPYGNEIILMIKGRPSSPSSRCST